MALAVFFFQAREQGCIIGYAWVGDSRIYLLRADETLICLTQGDSYLRQLVQAQLLTEQDAKRIDQAISLDSSPPSEQAHFQRRNGITQALGDPHPPVIHVDQTSLGAGDRILLCTDGIHDNLTDHEIETVLQRDSRSSVARALVERAQQRALQFTHPSMRAKPDDMSVVIVTPSSAPLLRKNRCAIGEVSGVSLSQCQKDQEQWPQSEKKDAGKDSPQNKQPFGMAYIDRPAQRSCDPQGWILGIDIEAVLPIAPILAIYGRADREARCEDGFPDTDGKQKHTQRREDTNDENAYRQQRPRAETGWRGKCDQHS